jgi:prepilin-type processing-associated H-X9-DG protein
MANVLFLDGHAEGVGPTQNPLPSYWPASAVALLNKNRLWDIGTTDDLFDRE